MSLRSRTLLLVFGVSLLPSLPADAQTTGHEHHDTHAEAATRSPAGAEPNARFLMQQSSGTSWSSPGASSGGWWHRHAMLDGHRTEPLLPSAAGWGNRVPAGAGPGSEGGSRCASALRQGGLGRPRLNGVSDAGLHRAFRRRHRAVPPQDDDQRLEIERLGQALGNAEPRGRLLCIVAGRQAHDGNVP